MLPEIFQFDFMLRAFAVGGLVAIVAPVIGSFLVVRRLSPIADTLSHASLLGVAIALLAGLAPVPVALAVTAVAAVGIEFIRTNTKTYGEAVLTLILSGCLGAALVLISLGHGFTADLFSYLFGSIATTTPLDLILVAVLSCVVLLAVWRMYPQLFLIALDEELAAAHGVPVRKYTSILALLAGITIGLSLRIVGALLIGALMTLPVIAALQLRLSFAQSMFAAIGFAVAAVFAGLTAAYYLDLAPGGSIVLVLVSCFCAGALFGKVSAK